MVKKSLLERCGVQIFSGFDSVAEAFSYLSLRNIKVAEVNLNNPYFLAQLSGYKERNEIAKVTETEGVKWVAHLPDCTGFFEIEEEVFSHYLGWLIRIQERARKAGCQALTLHLGMAPSFAWSGERKRGVDLFRDFYETSLLVRLRRMANLLRKGPPVCIENTSGFNYDFVRETLDKIDGLYYTMDIGHLLTPDPEVAQDHFEFFKRHKKKIRVVHVHYNDGEWDQHLSLTDTKRIEPYLSFGLETGAYLIMEVRPLDAAIASLSTLIGVEF